MALLQLYIPAVAPLTGLTLATLADAQSGTAIALPSPATWTRSSSPVVRQSDQVPCYLWTITVSASASASVAYTTVVLPGGTPGPGGVEPGDLVVPAGQYASISDVYGLFGEQNVVQWSRLDNISPKVLNNSRAQASLNYADSEIDSLFTGIIATPIPRNPTLTNAAATIAGGWLYNSRGSLDTIQGAFGDKVVNKYAGMVRAVYADLQNYRCGIKQFAGATFTASLAPSVVTGARGYYNRGFR